MQYAQNALLPSGNLNLTSQAGIVNTMDRIGSRGRKESLWDMAVRIGNEQESQPDKNDQQERTILFLGSNGVGKSSLIYRYLERSDVPKPTLALEYAFGRRSGHGLMKDTVHVWELGGGTTFTSLISPLLTPEVLASKTVSIVLMLDLSSPQTLWKTFDVMMKVLNNIIRELKMKKPETYGQLLAAAWKRVGKEHVDASKLDPFALPITILGGKYDLFAHFDPEQRKIICRCLRFSALTIGASLQFYSVKDPLLSKRGRDLMNHYGFGTSPPKAISQDYNAPLAIPAGSDTIQHIGIAGTSTLEHIKHVYTTHFPQKNSEKEGDLPDDPVRNPSFREPVIDTLRAQKDEELERLCREIERRQKLGQISDIDLDL